MLHSYKEKISHWIWYDKDIVSSTNDEIKSLIKNNMVVLSAKEQTNGRGRRGNKWQNGCGNLYFSYNLKIEPKDLSKIVCLIGLSLAKTIKKLAPHLQTNIKWPNDVFVENKKISGILLENIKEHDWVIGIGVNITTSPQIENKNYKATSLAEVSIKLDRIKFMRYYLENFTKDLEQYEQEGFINIKKEWLDYALNYKKEITIKTETDIKTGIFYDIDDNGYLILKNKEKEEKIIAGDLFI